MKQSEAIKKFTKLYWDDLTPEQINFLGQTEHEVAQLEAIKDRVIELLDDYSVVDDKLRDLVRWEPPYET